VCFVLGKLSDVPFFELIIFVSFDPKGVEREVFLRTKSLLMDSQTAALAGSPAVFPGLSASGAGVSGVNVSGVSIELVKDDKPFASSDGYAITEATYADFDEKWISIKPPEAFSKGGATSWYGRAMYSYPIMKDGRPTGARTIADAKIEFPSSAGNRIPCKAGFRVKMNFSKEELERKDKNKDYIPIGTPSGDYKSMWELDPTNSVHAQLIHIIGCFYRQFVIYLQTYGSGKRGTKRIFPMDCDHKPGILKKNPIELAESTMKPPVWCKDKPSVELDEDGQEVPITIRDLDSPSILSLFVAANAERKKPTKIVRLVNETGFDDLTGMPKVDVKEKFMKPEELVNVSVDGVPLITIATIVNTTSTIRLTMESVFVEDTAAIGTVEQKTTIEKSKEARLVALRAEQTTREQYRRSMMASKGLTTPPNNETPLPDLGGASGGGSGAGILPPALSAEVRPMTPPPVSGFAPPAVFVPPAPAPAEHQPQFSGFPSMPQTAAQSFPQTPFPQHTQSQPMFPIMDGFTA